MEKYGGILTSIAGQSMCLPRLAAIKHCLNKSFNLNIIDPEQYLSLILEFKNWAAFSGMDAAFVMVLVFSKY